MHLQYTVRYCNSFLNWQYRSTYRYSFPILVLISISSINEYVPSLPRVDGMHRILFRYHFH